MDLLYILKILYKRIWIIILVPIIAGIFAFLYTQNLEKKYKSSAQLSTGFTTNNRVQLTKENFDYWESRSNFENLIEMMKSELIGSMVTYDLLLHDLKEEKPFRVNEGFESLIHSDSVVTKLKEKIESFTLLSSYDEFENQIIELLNKKGYIFNRWIKDGTISINRIKDTDFVKVEFSSESPFLSAFVVNRLCEEYIRYNNAVENSVGKESLTFFSNEVKKRKEELDAKTEQLNQFKISNQVFNYDKESSSKISQLNDYEIKLQEEENNEAGLVISLKSINDKILALSTPGEVTNNAKLLELRSKINELNKIYIDKGSSDKELEKTIEELRVQLQTEMQKVDVGPSIVKGPKTLNELKAEKDQVEIDLAISRSNLASIKNKINTLQGSVSTIGSKEYTIASLERERENVFKDYTIALEKLNEAKSKSLISGNNVKLMIAGQPNPKPEPSKRLAIIAISIAGSFCLCIGVFLMVEYFDYSLKTPDRFERFTKIKQLGYLNNVSSKVSGFPFAIKGKEARDIELMMNLLRKIRFNIENSGKQVILVSSTNTADGKTFFIKSLSQSLSLLNKKVLIIDTNFRNNSLSQLILGNKMLQKPSEFKLLNDASIDHDTHEEDSTTIIFSTSDKNVDIIGSRRGFESPSEMFAGKDFVSLIEGLRLKYNYILMEGPCLNEYSDTKELVQFADGVISVFSAKSSLVQKDRDSLKYLKSLNGKFMGGILNFVQEDEVRV